MPTGYTDAVGTGKIADFRTFALRCARAMMPTIMQRDDPINEPPRLMEASTYSDEQLITAQKILARLCQMSIEEATAASEEERAMRIKKNEEIRKEHREIRDRYLAMLHEVESWTPPTPEHVGMKQFMIRQLTESINFDCNDTYIVDPQWISAAKWLAAQKEKARADVAYHAKSAAEERSRTAERNTWITALFASLPAAKSDG